MRAVADTAPLLSAVRDDDPAHGLAKYAVARLRRELIVLDTVAVELDYMLRKWVGSYAARTVTRALVDGTHQAAFLSPGLLRRASEIDEQYADLKLGLVDASVMAYAERHELPILTFDFKHFRATAPRQGHWRLVIDEAQLARFTD